MGVRFHTGAAPVLLRLPAHEFIDQHVPLATVDARLARRLSEAVARATDEREVFGALNRELMRMLDGPDPDLVVREAVVLLDRGSTTVAECASTVFLSERQLQRRFDERVGYRLARWLG